MGNPKEGKSVEVITNLNGQPIELHINTRTFPLEQLKELVRLRIEHSKNSPCEIKIGNDKEVLSYLPSTFLPVLKAHHDRFGKVREKFYSDLEGKLFSSDYMIIRDVSVKEALDNSGEQDWFD